MKLLRYGPKGQEKPGLLDAQGQVRDLSAVIDDIGGAALLPESLAHLRTLARRKRACAWAPAWATWASSSASG